ncbi:MAG TPA: hypothetical protein VK659_14645 [Asanoa sp.]|nr:hypothetical protein [Asanoa sp.]
MSLKDAATRAAVLGALHEAIGAELKTAKAELQQGLKAAKQDSGTQQIGVSLPDGKQVGKVTLVQPKPTAVVTDAEKFTAWVLDTRPGEIVRRFVTEVRPAWTTQVLKEIAAAGVVQWCDRETGEVHDVPGVVLQPRSAYPRMTIPDDGAAAIAQAWRTGTLAADFLPQLTAGASDDAA